MAISLRYHAETDTYYIQIRGTQYEQLRRKIRRLTVCIDHLQGERHAEEKARLEEYRKRLLQERRQAQYYVIVPACDLPENAHARPIHNIPGQVMTAGAEQYAQLLDKLQAGKSKGDES